MTEKNRSARRGAGLLAGDIFEHAIERLGLGAPEGIETA
jgi:hypothetical protein